MHYDSNCVFPLLSLHPIVGCGFPCRDALNYVNQAGGHPEVGSPAPRDLGRKFRKAVRPDLAEQQQMMFNAMRQGLQATTSLVYCLFLVCRTCDRMLGLRVRCGSLLGGAQVGLKAITAHACSSGSLSPAHTLWGYCPARCTSALARLRLLCRTCSLRRRVWCRNLWPSRPASDLL